MVTARLPPCRTFTFVSTTSFVDKQATTLSLNVVLSFSSHGLSGWL